MTKGNMQKELDNMEGKNRNSRRQDAIVWLFGIFFIVCILASSWAWGLAKGWHAPSGYLYYNSSNTTMERFLPLSSKTCNDTIIGSSRETDEEDCGRVMYFWRLKPEDASMLTNAIVWLLYSLHQLFMWGLIYRAQLTVNLQNKTKEEKYSTNLNWFNWSLLGVNGLFHVLHLVQTHITYDATAQTVSISSSQSSVIMMMVFILVLEYKQRGLFLMWPNPESNDPVAKKLRLSPTPIDLVRKYHGYCFSWAVIYTFWYHPMENTWGHTLGFFHTAIVMLQGSLIFTKIHLNRYWRLLNESWVLVHGILVAFQTGKPSIEHRASSWPKFFMGFGFMFCFTQIFSLPFWRKLNKWIRVVPGVLFIVLVLVLCAVVIPGKTPGESGFSRLKEIVYIPLEMYITFLIAWAVLYGFLFIESNIGKCSTDVPPISPSPTKQAVYICCTLLVYVVFIIIAYLIENSPRVLMDMTYIMILLVLFFTLGCCITFMLLKKLIPLTSSSRSIMRRNTEAPMVTLPHHDNHAYVTHG